MKKLMMLSALLLLTVVCVKAETGEGMAGTCTCADGSTGMLVSGGNCVCHRDSDIPGSCTNVQCPDGQPAMMTGRGCKCPSSRDIVNAMNNNGPVMRMNAPKPS